MTMRSPCDDSSLGQTVRNTIIVHLPNLMNCKLLNVECRNKVTHFLVDLAPRLDVFQRKTVFQRDDLVEINVRGATPLACEVNETARHLLFGHKMTVRLRNDAYDFVSLVLAHFTILKKVALIITY